MPESIACQVESTRSRSAAGCLAVLAIVIANLVSPVCAETSPRELMQQMRSTELHPEAAVSLRNVELEMGLAVIDIDRGVLIPARTTDGRTVELVFIGQAQLRIDPPDLIEASQIELFTGRRTVAAAIEEAVVVLANEQTVEHLLDRPAPLELREELLDRAREIHARWLLKPERRNTGVEGSIYKFLVGDPAFRDYFALWSYSYELGNIVYQLDPEEEEQLTLASFVPLDISNWERQKLARHIRIQQRKGRFMGVRVGDLGAWDIWLSSAWSHAEKPSHPPNTGFEPRHYEVDLSLDKRTLVLDGTARIDLEAQSSDRQVVTFDLFRDLQVESVHDEQGRELFAFRSGGDVLVHLPEPPAKGEQVRLTLKYGGRALQWVGAETFDLEDTRAWHPHCGTVDRATYDVTLRWPKRYDIVASGRRVAGGRNGKQLWERRLLEAPAIAFSFAVGKFETEQKRFGHVDVTLAFNKDSAVVTVPGERARALDTIGRSLQYFESVFGAYPLDQLSVVTLPRRYSQSYLGFITLSDAIMKNDTATQRETTTAHEVAHQWWGNLVGWWSYRDQWLSEAMANYSALLYHSERAGDHTRLLARMSVGWRESLGQRTRDGRTIESVGPMVLGGRLNSSLTSSAYRAVVYSKGAAVLAMLARAIGEEEFVSMLGSLADVAANRVLTTESFLDSMERMSGLNLDGFARRFVYGTGIPRVYYDYESEPNSDGGWKLRGEARLLYEPSFEYRIVREPEGPWNLTRRASLITQPSPSSMMVPFRLSLDDPTEPVRASGVAVVQSRRGQLLMISGSHQEFELDVDTRPLDLQLDPRGEILASFHSVPNKPKLGLRFRAQDLALEGKLDEAESIYQQALEQPPDGERGSGLRGPGADAALEDARIRLGLARLYLDQGRDDAASVELGVVEQFLDGDLQTYRMERDALGARLEIRRGDYLDAFKRLKRTLRRAAPIRGPRNYAALVRQVQLNSERQAVIEGFALLAVAAYEVRKPEDFEWALLEAKERGVDLSTLEKTANESGFERRRRERL